MASRVTLRNKVATFLACELDCNSGRLSIDGTQQKLEPMVHQFLVLLIEHQGSLVSKEIVVDTLWPSKKPTDEALRAMVKKAREALKDDARNPHYIKTVPTKGYLLIPPVELRSTVLQSWFQANRKLSLVAGLVVTIFATFALWLFLGLSPWSQGPQKMVITKSNVSVVNDQNVSTYSVANNMYNIWVESADVNDASQVKMENIETKQQQKIVFTVPLKRQFWFSQGSQRLLVMRNDNEGFYSIQFNRQGSEPSIIEYPVALPNDLAVLAYDFTGNYLYVSSLVQNTIGLFSLESGKELAPEELPAAITNLSMRIEEAKLPLGEQLNLSANTPITYNIWPSPVSSGFMVKLDTHRGSYLLYYGAHDSGELNANVAINSGLQSAVWNAQGNRFSFTNDNATIIALQIEEGRLTVFNANGELINQVVLDCGASCFIIANTQGVPKLSEFAKILPFPANEAPRRSQYAQVVSSNSIARNEYLPYFSARGLYFVSQQEDYVNIIFRDLKNVESVIYQFDKQAIVDELTVDTGDDYVAGIVNQRLFLLDLTTLSIRYIPVTFPKVSHIAFDESEDQSTSTKALRFFAQTRGSVQASNGPLANGLYEYEIDTQQLRLLQGGVKFQTSIEVVQVNEGGAVSSQVLFTLNSNQQIKLEYTNNKPSVLVNIGDDDCMGCWQIRGNYLYQLQASSQSSNQFYLVETSLITAQQRKQAMLFKDLQSQFSLHPTLDKMAVSTRQNLQTELIRIEGLSQIY